MDYEDEGATNVRCKWDNLARDWIVYPRADGEGRPIGEDDKGKELT